MPADVESRRAGTKTFRAPPLLFGVDSLQLTARHQVATPVNWKSGDDVIILPAVTNEAAHEKFPDGWKELKPYLRVVPQRQG